MRTPLLRLARRIFQVFGPAVVQDRRPRCYAALTECSSSLKSQRRRFFLLQGCVRVASMVARPGRSGRAVL